MAFLIGLYIVGTIVWLGIYLSDYTDELSDPEITQKSARGLILFPVWPAVLLFILITSIPQLIRDAK